METTQQCPKSPDTKNNIAKRNSQPPPAVYATVIVLGLVVLCLVGRSIFLNIFHNTLFVGIRYMLPLDGTEFEFYEFEKPGQTSVLLLRSLNGDGKSKAILFCHGNYGNVSFNALRLMQFRQKYPDHDVYCHDYPGFGCSDGHSRVDDFYMAGVRLLNHLSAKYDSVMLAGESLGGSAAIAVCASPDLVRAPSRVIVINSFSRLSTLIGEKMGAVCGWLCGSMQLDIDSGARLKVISARYPKLHFTFIACDGDMTVTPHHSRIMYESIKSQARLLQIKGTHIMYDLKLL